MVEPNVVAASWPRTFTIKKREDAPANVNRICGFAHTAVLVCARDGAPARPVVIPEFASAEIGAIGIAIRNEGVYPEGLRGFAMNGAEIVIRPNPIEPSMMSGRSALRNRAQAIFNQAYALAPNLVPTIQDDGDVVDQFGGRSMIVDSRARLSGGKRVGRQEIR